MTATSSGATLTETASIPNGPAVQERLENPGSINFLLPSDPVQLSEISFSAPVTDPVTLTFQYDDTNLFVADENDLVIRHYERRCDSIGGRHHGECRRRHGFDQRRHHFEQH